VTYGTNEMQEFKRQARDFAAAVEVATASVRRRRPLLTRWHDPEAFEALK
jgi:hypothetical protein